MCNSAKPAKSQQRPDTLRGLKSAAHHFASGDMIWGWSQMKAGSIQVSSKYSPTSLSIKRAAVCGRDNSRPLSLTCVTSQSYGKPPVVSKTTRMKCYCTKLSNDTQLQTALSGLVQVVSAQQVRSYRSQVEGVKCWWVPALRGTPSPPQMPSPWGRKPPMPLPSRWSSKFASMGVWSWFQVAQTQAHQDGIQRHKNCCWPPRPSQRRAAQLIPLGHCSLHMPAEHGRVKVNDLSRQCMSCEGSKTTALSMPSVLPTNYSAVAK